MRTEASTENPPPCPHSTLSRASLAASRPRRTKVRRSRWRTCSCTFTSTMAVASSPVVARKTTPPAASDSNTPSMTTQWKCRWALRLEPKALLPLLRVAVAVKTGDDKQGVVLDRKNSA